MAAATVLTNAGRALQTARNTATSGISAVLAPFMAFGKGVGTAAVTATALITELTTSDVPSYARQAVTGSQVTTTVTNDTYKQAATLSASAAVSPVAVTEAGTFDASTVGNMYLYATFAAINIVGSDSIAMVLEVAFA